LGETLIAFSFGNFYAMFFLALFGLATNIFGLAVLMWTLW
jgi:hypothetical protein